MKHISQLLVDVAKFLANPRLETAAWEARHAIEAKQECSHAWGVCECPVDVRFPEPCDPFCWCLDCQDSWEINQPESGCKPVSMSCCGGLDSKFTCGTCECTMSTGCFTWCECIDCYPEQVWNF